MHLFQSEQVIKLQLIWLLQTTSLIFKSQDLNPLDYHVHCTWVRYWDAIHVKADQRCRAEDCLAIDVEWFATAGIHW